jgi:RecA/RadA recombinase
MEVRRRRAAIPANKSLEQQIIDGAETDSGLLVEQIGPECGDISTDRLIPSGVTLLNCACSDNPFGAFVLGTINTIPGKSASGKTELMLTMLASCAVDKRFDDYELILDDAERTMSFNLDYLFPRLSTRLAAPAYDGDEPIYSNTIQDLENNILLRCIGKKSRNKPFIYVLDSLDSLSSTQELEREYKNALKMAKSDEAVKEIQKSYGTEKARIIGAVFRMINGRIKDTDGAFFVVQQTRQRINKNFGETDWITSGGEAPFFYSFHRVYLDSGKNLTGESMGVKHKIGGRTHCQVVKNKLTGKRRSIDFDIYEDLGIDDVCSCVDFLKFTKHWPTVGAYMEAPGILGRGEKMYRSEIISLIEREGLEVQTQTIVGQVWNQIEKDIRLHDRKRRFV